MVEENEEKITPKKEEKIQKSLSLVEQASIVAERIEKANQKSEELLRQQEDLYMRMTLGGKSEGKKPEEPKEIISPQDYAKNALKGLI